MSIEKCIMVLLTTVLILSMVGTAVESTEKAGITVISKSLEIDKNLNKEIVLIHINSSITGHLNYLEKYYSKNDTDALNLDSAVMYYNDTMSNNTLNIKIKRPLDKSGNSYKLIKALIFIDNRQVFDTWFTFSDKKKESPGFEVIIAMISIVFTTYIFRKRNM